MGKWTKNHALELGSALAAIGLLLTVVSFTYAFADEQPAWLDAYHGVVERPEGNWNLILFIAGPILLIWGGFLIGEQLVLRRRFERLINTPKRSEFTARRRDLEDLTKRLPDAFGRRLDDKEAEFKTKRSA